MREQPTDETASLRTENDGQPPYLYPDYVATQLRAPEKPLIILPRTLSDTTGPAYGRDPVGELDNDLTRQHAGEPLGERIIVTGRVLDGDGRPVRNSLIEVWQANAAGRYTHQLDQHPAPWTPTSLARAAASPTTRAATCSSRSSLGPTRGRTTTTPGGQRTYISRCSGMPLGAAS